MENNNELKLLVITFFFPPYKRVGGRRWAKHVKYLHRLGVNTHVLTGEFPNSSSSWDDDVVEYKHIITRLSLLPGYRPYFETTLPENLKDKIKWKASYYAYKFRKYFFKGNFKDASLPNMKNFLQGAREIIKKNSINTVILSVGPFAYSEMLLELKRNFPGIKCVLDYRDPWEESLGQLSQRQKKYELKKQRRVLKGVDMVLTVNDDISERIRKIYSRVKVITVPHCVDEDFLGLELNMPTLQQKHEIKLIYGGELYAGLQKEMENFVKIMKQLPGFVGKTCVAELYSPYPSYEPILAADEHISIHQALLKNDYLAKLVESDAILLFKSPLSSEAFFSSKFYELLCLRKPLLFFGKAGQVSDFIKQHKLGFHVTAENIESSCEAIKNNFITREIPDRSYDTRQHSFAHHTKLLINQLQELRGIHAV